MVYKEISICKLVLGEIDFWIKQSLGVQVKISINFMKKINLFWIFISDCWQTQTWICPIEYL